MRSHTRNPNPKPPFLSFLCNSLHSPPSRNLKNSPKNHKNKVPIFLLSSNPEPLQLLLSGWSPWRLEMRTMASIMGAMASMFA
ncbi:hypothetical protein ABKV19_006697 [Rosa sericea]